MSECLLNLKPATGLCVRPAAGLCVRPVVEGGYCPRLKVGIAAGGEGIFKAFGGGQMGFQGFQRGERGISRLSALTRQCHPGLNFQVKFENR